MRYHKLQAEFLEGSMNQRELSEYNQLARDSYLKKENSRLYNRSLIDFCLFFAGAFAVVGLSDGVKKLRGKSIIL